MAVAGGEGGLVMIHVVPRVVYMIICEFRETTRIACNGNSSIGSYLHSVPTVLCVEKRTVGVYKCITVRNVRNASEFDKKQKYKQYLYCC